jgi:hypothetical protein
VIIYIVSGGLASNSLFVSWSFARVSSQNFLYNDDSG